MKVVLSEVKINESPCKTLPMMLKRAARVLAAEVVFLGLRTASIC